MKERAQLSGAKPAQVFAEGTVPLASTTKARLPLEDSAKRTLRNKQRANIPKMPVLLKDLVIEGKL